MKNTDLSEKKCSRILWIDIARVVGVQVVLIGHISNSYQSLIFSWHMPFFFILSGLCIGKQKNLKKATVRDAKTLMIPFFLFSILGLLVEYLKRATLDRPQLEYVEKIGSIVVWMDYNSLSGTYGFVLWFLPCLFFSKLLLRFLTAIVESSKIQAVFVIILGCVGASVDIPFAIDNALVALPFVWFGFFLTSYFTKLDKIVVSLLAIVIGITVLVTMHHFVGIPLVDMAVKRFSPFGFAVLWATIFSVLIMVIIKTFASGFSFLNRIAPYGIYMYVLHPYTHNLSTIILQKINMQGWFLVYAISLFLLTGLFFIFNKNYKLTV